MKVTLLIVTAALCTGVGASTVGYTESDAVIANPLRGFQKYSITDARYATVANHTSLDSAGLASWRTGSDKVTVIFRYFLLEPFIESDISAIYLDNIRRDFSVIRKAGLKILVRFSYRDEQSSLPQQPVKSRIFTHIRQLAPVIRENRDVIAAVQAGFIGTWGEWYYTNSDEFGTDGTISTAQWNNRKQVVDSMLAGFPADLFLQVRYPEVKKKLYGSTPLTPETAYRNTPQARIGFFNDAFLNNWGDMGTFSVSNSAQDPKGTDDYRYLAGESRFTPMSGETNGLNPPRTDGANAIVELDSCNWSLLNRDYYTQNFTNWIAAGQYAAMQRNLGYRFVLKQSTVTMSASRMSLSFTVVNRGYAPPFERRPLYLVLIGSNGARHPFPLEADIRRWEDSVAVNETVDCAALSSGEYRCALALPDPDSVLALRPEYAIRFANDAICDSVPGLIMLNQRITVTQTGIAGGNTGNSSLMSGVRVVMRRGSLVLITDNAAHSSGAPVSLTLLDGKGRQVCRKAGLYRHSGEHVFPIPGTMFCRGIYLVRIALPGGVCIKKCLATE
ncbi:MAG: DUF4832 domain-containing protein [Chitinispirillaceae bacterium]|nr:DUF4832 domain-containing protein [Chitinispirillaceae bacterium]